MEALPGGPRPGSALEAYLAGNADETSSPPCESEQTRHPRGKPHEFWDTQPVPKKSDPEPEDEQEGVLEEKSVQDVRQTPYDLPEGLEWISVDASDAAEMQEVYDLLYNHYVEDDDGVFRFDYSQDFLRWAMMPPGFHRDWHVGIRATSPVPGESGILVALVTGVPVMMAVQTTKGKHHQEMCEINFLCCHQHLRGRRIAPLLIKEITRRVNLLDIWQAVYTAGVELPTPVTSCQYWHRSINPKKLISVGFSYQPPRTTMKMLEKRFILPDEPLLPGFRRMQMADTESACELLNGYLESYTLHPVYSLEDFRHWLMPLEGVFNTYVITNEAGSVTDLCSFYKLPSTIMGHSEYSTLYTAYSYYNVATTVSLEALMYDALIMAKQQGFDVFNALDCMENKGFFENLKFVPGNGHLRYYLYNFRVKSFLAEETGLVLL